ncbi:IQ domain-containing protein C isoform X2 [Ambystoma mexicanum]|uniref:IQ domain-containing protein C isoform X2 n=1 Tax=Ambystoma mexicanum TaxID=8296 RepID=UPI0037E837E4
MEAEEIRRRVTALQAHVRGFLVRRRFLRLRKDYECVVQDIEGSLDGLRWSGHFIPRPGFCRARKGWPLNEQELFLEVCDRPDGVQDQLLAQKEEPEKDVPRDRDMLCQHGTKERSVLEKDGGAARLDDRGEAGSCGQRLSHASAAGEQVDWIHCSTGSSVWTSSFSEPGQSAALKVFDFEAEAG